MPHPTTPSPHLPILLTLLLSSLSPAAPQADTRLPIPSPADQAKALRLVHDVFKHEYTDLRNRLPFSATLLKNAIETNNDPAAKYVLFREARDQAIAAAVLAPALKAADALAQAFAVDPTDTRIDTLRRVWSAAPVNAAVAKPFIDLCLKSSQQAAGTEDFTIAEKYAALAEEFARKVRDPSALARARDWNTLLHDTAAEADQAKAASKKLETDPHDTNAKTTLARWLCCWKGDWSTGLPLLASGSDPALAALARRDQAGAPDSTAAFELAGAWWTYAEKAPRPWNTAAKQRAADWYNKSIPLLTGLQKVLAEKRLTEAAEQKQQSPQITFAPKSDAKP